LSKRHQTGKKKAAEPEREVRLDKWLKVARIFKTRSLAQEAIEAGHVKSGTRSVKPGRTVKVGDRFKITKGRHRLLIEVLQVTKKSVSAKDSHDLYQVLEDHMERDEHQGFNRLLDQIEGSRRGKGRPTKRERRQIDKFTDQDKD